MKLFALTCGRKNGTCEILTKEALMGAEELGVTVEMIRLVDMDIKTCKFCKRCLAREDGAEACIQKDDIPFIKEKLMECDGLILAAPVYILTPPGYLKLLADRVLQDMSGVMAMKKYGDWRTGRPVAIDERALKRRAGGFITVGGAPLHYWISLGLPLMHCLTFPRQIDIIDQMEVMGVSNVLGAVVLNDKALQRARLLGRHVGETMTEMAGKYWDVDVLGNVAKQSMDRPKWRGDKTPGTCPVCHTDLMLVGKKSPVECAVCGIQGDIKIEKGKIKVVFSKEEREKSRLTIEGKRIHQVEIRETTEPLMKMMGEIAEKVKKYKSYDPVVNRPRKKKK